MKKNKDVTKQVKFEEDIELESKDVNIIKCVCGKTFEFWEFPIEENSGNSCKCSSCGRNIFFTITIKVRIFEVQ
jgi:hypothetical protein